MNRDLNGALNIRLKGKMQLLNKEIPEYLQRKKQIEENDEETEKKEIKIIRRTSSVKSFDLSLARVIGKKRLGDPA